jgi:hypothetical protein
MKTITPQTNVILSGEKFFIEFEIIAKDSEENPIIEEGKATILVNNKIITTTEVIRNGINRVQVD